jgi:hypothetical protein
MHGASLPTFPEFANYFRVPLEAPLLSVCNEPTSLTYSTWSAATRASSLIQQRFSAVYVVYERGWLSERLFRCSISSRLPK